MAHFQIGHSSHFPGGTRLHVNTTWDDQKLVVHGSNRITLELLEWSDSWGKPTIDATAPNPLSISTPAKGSGKWTFTVQGRGAGATILKAMDSTGNAQTTGLHVFAGTFLNHTGMKQDLIANVFRAGNPGKMHTLMRLLHNSVNNLFNENSDYNIKKHGPLACGTVSKVGGQKVFFPGLDYDYQRYHKPIVPKTATINGKTQQVWTLSSREEVTYEKTRIQQGLNAIRQRLQKGLPSVLGLAYYPFSSLQPGGWLKPMGTGGHSVLVVGHDDKDRFLYIDPFGPNGSGEPEFRGSILHYAGGPTSAKPFSATCEYLGIFEAKPDPLRGGSIVLRQDPNTQAPGGMFDADQYLEVISGPLN
jgi:hypothetical protein